MNLVADESIEAQIVERLRGDGHAVPYVAEMSPSVTDNEVLSLANNSDSPLLTGDKDFGELVFRLRRATHGVILVRLPGLSPRTKAEVVSEAITRHGRDMVRAFTVISPGMIRIRRES